MKIVRNITLKVIWTCSNSTVNKHTERFSMGEVIDKAKSAYDDAKDKVDDKLHEMKGEIKNEKRHLEEEAEENKDT